MNTKLKKTAARLSPKNFVRRHPNITLGTIAGLTTLVVAGAAAQSRSAAEIDKFLESKGIDPTEFWLSPEDYAAFNNA